MKTEDEIRDKLKVLREEVEKWPPHPNDALLSVPHVISQERVNALEWVLGEYDEW